MVEGWGSCYWFWQWCHCCHAASRGAFWVQLQSSNKWPIIIDQRCQELDWKKVSFPSWVRCYRRCLSLLIRPWIRGGEHNRWKCSNQSHPFDIKTKRHGCHLDWYWPIGGSWRRRLCSYRGSRGRRRWYRFGRTCRWLSTSRYQKGFRWKRCLSRWKMGRLRSFHPWWHHCHQRASCYCLRCCRCFDYCHCCDVLLLHLHRKKEDCRRGKKTLYCRQKSLNQAQKRILRHREAWIGDDRQGHRKASQRRCWVKDRKELLIRPNEVSKRCLSHLHQGRGWC